MLVKGQEEESSAQLPCKTMWNVSPDDNLHAHIKKVLPSYAQCDKVKDACSYNLLSKSENRLSLGLENTLQLPTFNINTPIDKYAKS